MSTGEHLLHVLNTLESRAVVLEAELQEINEDIETNSILARKYGDSFFKEGSTRLSQAQDEKRQKLIEIRRQLQATNQSVRQGKQLLGSLTEASGRGDIPQPSLIFEASARTNAWEEKKFSPAGSPRRVMSASPILSEGKAQSRYNRGASLKGKREEEEGYLNKNQELRKGTQIRMK